MLKVIEGNVEQNWKTPYEVAKDIGLAIVEGYKSLVAMQKRSPWLDDEFEKPGVERNTLAMMFAAVITELQRSCRMCSFGDFNDSFKMAVEMIDDHWLREAYGRDEYAERLSCLFLMNHEKLDFQKALEMTADWYKKDGDPNGRV